jgi:hypothetical protein
MNERFRNKLLKLYPNIKPDIFGKRKPCAMEIENALKVDFTKDEINYQPTEEDLEEKND